MIVAYLCICKFKKLYNPGINSSIKYLKYILVRTLIVCFRNRHQDFLKYSTTFGRGDWKDDQIFRYSRFSFTVMSKKLIDFTKSLDTSYFELDG